MKTITKNSLIYGMAALLIASQLPAAAFADCTPKYQAEAKLLREKRYTTYMHESSGAEAGFIILGSISIIPGTITGILSTIDSIRLSDREKTLRLLADSRSGGGLQLVRVAQEISLSPERIAEAVIEMNSKDAFCREADLFSYSEVVELIRLTLSQ